MKSISTFVAMWLAFVPATFAFPASAKTIQIKINNLVFAPANTQAKIGDTIEWINADIVDHTATARNGDWDVNIPKGAKKSVELKKAGAVAYYCRVHPNMTGKLTVEAK